MAGCGGMTAATSFSAPRNHLPTTHTPATRLVTATHKRYVLHADVHNPPAWATFASGCCEPLEAAVADDEATGAEAGRAGSARTPVICRDNISENVQPPMCLEVKHGRTCTPGRTYRSKIEESIARGANRQKRPPDHVV